MRKADPNHAPDEAEVLADIAEYGVHIVHMLEGDAEDEQGRLLYSYTVGLWHSFQQPEVVVFGLPEEVANDLLDTIADNASDGDKYAAGERYDKLLQNFPVRMLELDDAARTERLGVGCWAYGEEAFPALQLVYPDPQGRWPWDETTRKGFRQCQPVVGRREPPA